MRTLLIGLETDIADKIRAEVRSPSNRVTILETLPEKFYTDQEGFFHVESNGIWFR